MIVGRAATIRYEVSVACYIGKFYASITYSRVGDLLLLVLAAKCQYTLPRAHPALNSRDVEVDSDEDSLALELEVRDGEFGRKGHCVLDCVGSVVEV